MARPVPRQEAGPGDQSVGLLLLCCLAALAGAVDASGYYLLKGRYVSFMSGNTTSMAASFARGDLSRAGLIGGIIASFVAGAAAGAVVGVLAGRRHVPVVILLAACVLLVPVWSTSWGLQAMAFAMGMLNGAIHEAGSIQVPVTYVTGTLARFGRGLGLLICGRQRDPAWLPQFVPWLGLVLGAIGATAMLLRFGDATLAALPVAAVSIAAACWAALPGAGSLPRRPPLA